MALRIALFGQAPIALGCLDALRQRGHEIAGVFAPPAAGRPDPLAARAMELGVPLFQRRYFQLKNGASIPKAVEEYRSIRADLNVLASLTAFLPGAIARAPRFGSVCFHPSLLPRYRGGNALQWQIIDGAQESGVSVFVPDAGVDTGPVLVQRRGVEISADDTVGTLFFEKLAPLGVEALVESVEQIAAGSAVPKPQDEAEATHQGLVDDAAAAIDLSLPAAQLARLVRGCDPQPGAFVRYSDQPVRLYGVRLEPFEGCAQPGEVVAVEDEDLIVALRGGRLRLSRVRADRAKESAGGFARRAGLAPGGRFENG